MKEPLLTRAILTFSLVFISALMLFVPVVEGASDVRAMFLMLTGIAVRDYFQARADHDRAEREDPTPPDAVIG